MADRNIPSSSGMNSDIKADLRSTRDKERRLQRFALQMSRRSVEAIKAPFRPSFWMNLMAQKLNSRLQGSVKDVQEEAGSSVKETSPEEVQEGEIDEGQGEPSEPHENGTRGLPVPSNSPEEVVPIDKDGFGQIQNWRWLEGLPVPNISPEEGGPRELLLKDGFLIVPSWRWLDIVRLQKDGSGQIPRWRWVLESPGPSRRPEEVATNSRAPRSQKKGRRRKGKKRPRR